MWPYMIRVNPGGLMAIILFSFGLYLLYSISTPSQLKRIPVYEPLNSGEQVAPESEDPFRINLKQLLIASIRAAETGGHEVSKIWNSANLQALEKGITKEGAKDLVTKGDLSSHKIMVHGLSATFPGLQIISEESHTASEDENEAIDDLEIIKPFLTSKEPVILSDELRKLPFSYTVPMKSVTIWIDPLDATQEYTESDSKLLKYVTTMVCVAINGKPAIGVIHKPFDHVTYWAWVGQNFSSSLHALKNSRQVVLNSRNKNAGNPKSSFGSARKPNSPKSVIVSRSHPGEVEKFLKDKLGDDLDIIHAGGAGYKIIEVVKGSADAYIHTSLIKKWDICAPNAIIDAIGGKMTTMKGSSISYSFMDDAKNEDGLLAATTFTDHHDFISKLKTD